MKRPPKPISDEDYRRTALKVKESIERELPILEQNLATLLGTENIIVLPDTIHNICVVLEREAYKFIQPAFNLYDYMDSENLNEATKHIIDTNKKVLQDLLKQETDHVAEQEAQMQKEKAAALKAKRPFDERVEREVFTHVEADISVFYRKLIMLLISGSYFLTPHQKRVLEEVRTLCIGILQLTIPRKRQALVNVKKILEAQH